MGFITDTIGDNTKALGASVSTECSNCTKAVAGMENNPDSSMSNRQEGHADQVVTKETEDAQYVVMTGAVGNLFTKALDVKFGNDKPMNELATPRTALESAAQDTLLQHKQLQALGQLNQPALSKSISDLRLGKSVRYIAPVKGSLVAQQALDELIKDGQAEWVFVNADAARVAYPMVDVLSQAIKMSPGYVDGIKSSYNIAKESSEDAIGAEGAQSIVQLLSKLRIKGVKIVVEVEDND